MWLYFLILRIASLFYPKAKELVKGQARSLAQLREIRHESERWIWIHAASTGEAEQALPVIEQMKYLLRSEQQQTSDIKILLTFFSPSGYNHFSDYKGVDAVLYLPFATRRNARRFIEELRPDMAVFVKYEYWPAYLWQLKKSNIPTYSIASIFRKSQAFFRPVIGQIYRRLLSYFTQLMVQDEASKLLLEQYGISNAIVCGDPRFNRTLSIANEPTDIISNALQFKETEKVIIAGSTWPKDERLLAKYIANRTTVRLVLVPHEIDEKHLHFIFNLFEGCFVRYSELNDRNIDSAQVILVDKMRLLSHLYRKGTVAYIGGGFGAGIHNTLEAAAYGMPVVFGPRYQSFREACDLKELGAGFSISNYAQLETTLDSLLAAPAQAGNAAKQYVLSEQFAAQVIANQLLQNLRLQG